MKPVIGLVVPALRESGGVRMAAQFLKHVIEKSGRFDLRLISLATSRRDGSSLRLLAPRSWRHGTRTKSDEWQGLPIVHVGATFVEFEYQRYRPRRALEAALEGCDLLQVVAGSPAWACAVENLKKPLSIHCATLARVERRRRDSRPAGFAGYWRKIMTVLTDRMDIRALRRADAIQVMNSWLLDYAREINQGRLVDVKMLPPGVDAGVFAPASSRSLRDPFILCVGRMNDPRKNVGLLLDVLKGLNASLGSRIRLVLAGQAGPTEMFWRRAAELGLRDRISFLHRPSSTELIALYQNAAVFVLPSDEEGFGIVLLEAMSCALPVVATRSGGPEDIVSDGVDGFLVQRDDPDGLAKRVLTLLRDEELNVTMGKRGRRKIEQMYDQDVIGLAFIEVWDRLLGIPGR